MCEQRRLRCNQVMSGSLRRALTACLIAAGGLITVQPARATAPAPYSVDYFSASTTAAANPYGIAAGPDGDVWFTDEGAGKIGRLSPSGTLSEFTRGISGAVIAGIAAGRDGAMWFTDYGKGQIGRITTSGV